MEWSDFTEPVEAPAASTGTLPSSWADIAYTVEDTPETRATYKERVAPTVAERPEEEIRLRGITEEARGRAFERMVDSPVLATPPVVGFSDGTMALLSTVIRPFNTQMSDDINSQRKGQREALVDVMQGSSMAPVTKIATGAIGSLTQAAMTGPAGFSAVVASQAASSANDSFTEAKSRGLSGERARGYALMTGAIEGVVTAAFGKTGLEKIVTQSAAKEAFKETALRIAKETPKELLEENVISFGQNVASWAYDVDPNAITPENMTRSALETSAQTMMTMGLAGGLRKATDVVMSPREALTKGTDEDVREPVRVWVEANPEKASRLAEMEKVSRKDFEEITGEKGVPADGRQRFLDTVKGVIQSSAEVSAEAVQPTGEQKGGEVDEEGNQEGRQEGLQVTPEQTDDESASIPFIVTNRMKADLRERGYTPEQIRLLTPKEAHSILKEQPDGKGQEAPTPTEEASGQAAPQADQTDASPEAPAPSETGGLKPVEEMTVPEIRAEAKSYGVDGSATARVEVLAQKIRQRRAESAGPETGDNAPLRSTRHIPTRIADVRIARAALGFDEVEGPEKTTWALDQKKALEQGLHRQTDRLVKEVMEEDRVLNSVESAAVEYRLAEIQDDIAQYDAYMTDKNLTDAEQDMLLAQRSALSSERDELMVAQLMYGSDRGRALQAQKRGTEMDFSEKVLLFMAKKAKRKNEKNPKAELTEKEAAAYKDDAKKIEEGVKKVRKKKAEAKEDLAQKDFNAAKENGKKRTKPDLDEELNGLVEKARLLGVGCRIS